MLAASFYFLISGINKKISKYFVLSGILVGLATLFRFPSFLAIFPFLVIVLFEHDNYIKFRHPRLLNWTNTIFFSMGFCVIISLSFFIALYLDVDETILKGFSSINNSVSGADESSHGVYKLLYKYLSDCVKFTPHFILGIVILYLSRWTFKSKITAALFYVSLGLFVFMQYRLLSKHDYDSNLKFLPIIMLGFIFVSTKYLFKNASILLILAILFTQVAGSNTGLFLKLSYGMILSLPVFIGLFISSENKCILPVHRFKFSSLNLMLILVLSLISRWCWVYHVEDSLLARISMNHTIQNPKLFGIMTNEKRAHYINDVMGILNDKYLADKSLLIANNEVLFYYLTNKAPLTVDFWLSNYTNDNIILEEIERNHKSQTLIVVSEKSGSLENISTKLMLTLKAKFNYKIIKQIQNNQIIEINLHDPK
jgi:hypothetical protein